MKKSILIALMAIVSQLISCDLKTTESARKYDAIITKEKLFIDSLRKLNRENMDFPGISDRDKISDTLKKFNEEFIALQKASTKENEKPTIDQMNENLDFIKTVGKYIENTHLSVK